MTREFTLRVVLAGTLLAELVAWWLLRRGILPDRGPGLAFWLTVALIVSAALAAALSCRWLVRHRFQFSIRSLLIAVGALGLLLGYTGHVVEQSREERANAAQLARAGARLSYSQESTPGSLLGWLTGSQYFESVTEVEWFLRSATSQDLAHLQALKSLRRLVLEERMNDEELAWLQSLNKLEFLRLDKPELSGSGLSHLESMTKLETLEIWGGYRVKDQQLVPLEGLAGLRRLCVANTPIGDAALRHVRGPRRLESLDLRSTGITDAGLEHLKALSSLRILELSHTKVTEAGVADLQEALPECKIVRVRVADDEPP